VPWQARDACATVDAMFLLIDDSNRGDTSAADELRAGGFDVLSVPISVLPQTVEAVAQGGGRIDAIVSISFNDEFIALYRRIRSLSEKLVFKGGVRARTTPLVFLSLVSVLSDPTEKRIAMDYNRTPIHSDDFPHWSTLVDASQASLVSAVTEAIQRWRNALIAELDYVGFTVSFDAAGRLEISHALRRRRRDAQILAPDGTPGSLRASQYLILAEDVLTQFSVYSELKHLLENYEAIANAESLKPETVFQRFFEKHPHLVQRGLFEKLWAKPKLRIPESPSKHLSPDFVLRPRIGADVGTNWEIMDLKLPDDQLVTSRSFHPAYAAKLTKAMQQLRNYRNYFSRSDDAVRRELVSQFGYQPVHPRLAILIGRREREVGLDRVQGNAGDLDIDVITYDDIIEFEENRLVLQGTIAGLFG